MVPPRQRTFVQTERQVSAGGVACRDTDEGSEIVIIKIEPQMRWQLPKGLIDEDELPEEAAVREVLEETGISAEIVDKLDTIEFWYFDERGEKKKRVHKRVHFYLMKYISGNTADHDHEVAEARWVTFKQAFNMLSFKSEREVVEKARQLVK